MRHRLCLALGLLLVLATLLAAGCGGDGDGKGSDTTDDGGRPAAGAAPDGAAYVPASALGFVALDTDFEGSQWNALDELSNKFPERAKLIAQIEQGLASEGVDFGRDVKPALGPETDIGVLAGTGEEELAVLLNEPKDATKLEALFRKLAEEGDQVFSEQLGDWRAVSDKQSAVAAAKAASDGASLAADSLFGQAMEALPAEALVKFWVSGAAIAGAVADQAGQGAVPAVGKINWLAGSAEAKSGGTRFHFLADRAGGTTAEPYSSELVGEIPSGVLAYVSFSSLDRPLNQVLANPALKDRVLGLEAQLGVPLAELAPLLAKEGAFYAREGAPLPEVTLVLQVDDEAAAAATADKLAAKIGPSVGATGPATTTEISGVTVKKLAGQQFALYYGAFDGKLVFTSSTTGITGLREGDKLDGDADFSAASDAAEMPDETIGFVYVNLKRLIPIGLNFATTAGRTVPPDVTGNLEPLRSLLFYGAADGTKLSVTGFLGLE
ncbi:MAG: hypothetical protein ABR521_02195 [Gaiellaceae bacterium]